MSKKAIYAIVAVVLVVLVVVGVILLTRNNNTKKELNLQELNTTFSEKAPFNEMATMDVTTETLETFFEISPENVQEVIGKMPLMNVHASMYLVIKATDDSVTTVKERVEQYATAQEQTWATYLPEQYELVQARKLGVIDNYVYLIISENSAELEALLK